MSESTIYYNSGYYNGGKKENITIDDIYNNKTAVKMIVNERNNLLKTVSVLTKQRAELKSKLEYQRTYPFYAVIALALELIGTVSTNIGVSMLKSDYNLGLLIIVIGVIVIVISGVLTIFHKFIRHNKNGQQE